MIQERAAHAAAILSSGSALTAWVATALPYVQLMAGCVAIVAGLFAIAVHVRKLRKG
jgi:hypothetical protein